MVCASIVHTRFELGWNLQRSPKYTVQVWILTEELVRMESSEEPKVHTGMEPYSRSSYKR
jgi:hypothetical protein